MEHEHRIKEKKRNLHVVHMHTQINGSFIVWIVTSSLLMNCLLIGMSMQFQICAVVPFLQTSICHRVMGEVMHVSMHKTIHIHIKLCALCAQEATCVCVCSYISHTIV